jgi:uncharacterized protein (DUF3820 family)
MKGYKDITLPFGKYKGQLLADVPNFYIAWLLDQEFVEEKFPKLYEMAKMESQYREEFGITI